MFIRNTLAGIQDGSIDETMATDVTHRAWLDTIESAEQFNDPGVFTTFLPYETPLRPRTAAISTGNVIFRASDKLPPVPFSHLNSRTREVMDWVTQ